MLTCKGFPPTKQLRCQHVGRFSLPGRQELQRHRAWPCGVARLASRALGPGLLCGISD